MNTFPTSDAMGTDLTRRFFNAADRTKMLRKQKELEDLPAQDKAFLANEAAKERMRQAEMLSRFGSFVPAEDQAGYEDMSLPEPSSTSSFVPAEEQYTGASGFSPAELDAYTAMDREFLNSPEASFGSGYVGSGDPRVKSVATPGSVAPKFSKEDADWFKKETGTAFNPNSVADVYYLMNRKYNEVSEAKADELERKRQKGSAATNLSRVQTMKRLMR